MRLLLLALLMGSPLFSFSQIFGFNASYYHDNPTGDAWHNENGVRFGFGVESIPIESAPLALSVRYTLGLSWSGYAHREENILFDLPADISNPNGYAQLDYSKIKVALEFDLGYQQDEFDLLEPYVTFGPQFENYISKIDYDLYEEDTCYCFLSPRETLSQTMSLGFNSGIGLKFKPSERIFFDLRATYYGGWTLHRENSIIMPQTETFYIDNQGIASYESTNKRYNQGFNISLGIIVSLEGLGSVLASSSSSGYYDDDDDSSYDSSSEESSGSSSGGGGSTCTPVTLTPAGGRSGPPD
ncbi:MAG: hypothetical protein ACI837_000651 [Crocinitomicaceae bacterium]|jgi:hypothetical protein